MSKAQYYHFVGSTLRDGSPIPANGEWLEYKGEITMCQSGLHASAHVADAARYAPGNTLCLVELEGIADEHDDKLVAARRKIVARFDATELLRADALQSALSVAHLWKMPAIVRQYLETGDEAIRQEARNAAAVAHAASYAAAYAAYAAYAAADAADAAANAAYAAAYAADAADARVKSKADSRARLKAAVDAKFEELCP
jgi:hypothetical protein